MLCQSINMIEVKCKRYCIYEKMQRNKAQDLKIACAHHILNQQNF